MCFKVLRGRRDPGAVQATRPSCSFNCFAAQPDPPGCAPASGGHPRPTRRIVGPPAWPPRTVINIMLLARKTSFHTWCKHVLFPPHAQMYRLRSGTNRGLSAAYAVTNFEYTLTPRADEPLTRGTTCGQNAAYAVTNFRCILTPLADEPLTQ